MTIGAALLLAGMTIGCTPVVVDCRALWQQAACTPTDPVAQYHMAAAAQWAIHAYTAAIILIAAGIGLMTL